MAHLQRIEAVNPRVNAIVTQDADAAMAAAHNADQRHAAGEPLGTLHGLPVAHKDLNVTAGMRTTFGSPLFAEHVPDVDALIVARAKAAGAITVGKTNTPEFGAGSQTFNPVFGATGNPWDPTRTCGGSSGGAAVALACGMVPIADGSDMGGSLRNPASFCGVAGLRPSPGRVPTYPARHPYGTLSVDGPMARTVADLAFFLSALAGPDSRCPVSIDEEPAIFGGPLERDLHGVRVAWSPRLGDLPVDEEVRNVMEAARPVFEALGCDVREADPPLQGADEAFETLRAFQFELSYGALYDRNAGQMKASVQWNIEAGRRLSGPDVGRAEVLRGKVFAAMADFFERYDVLVAPVSQVQPFPVALEHPSVVDGRQMNSYIEWMRSCSRLSITACPALSVPAGFSSDGLPIGLQLVGPYRGEWPLLQVGHMVEVALGAAGRRPPVVQPSSS
ncbi:MAG: amidase [Acidimicrobiia bacterium]|jgi:amidase|nr:amidase [Acidimicrobiia bacterium]